MILLLALALAIAAPTDNTITAFVGVSVLPMDSERVLPDHTVLVRGDRIVEIGPSDAVDVPDGAVVIDGSGRYLLPGLAEMHGHIPSPENPAEAVEHTLFLYLANGITTVRGMLGFPGQLELKERANAGEIASPMLYLAGPSFNGNSISSPAQAEERVRTQKAEGWDLLKIHPGLTLAEYDAMARTAAEVAIRFGGHVPADVGLVHAIEMGQETFDHLDGYVEYLFSVDPEGVDEVALAGIVSRTVEAGAWVVPTMVLWETLYGTSDLDQLMAFPELRYVDPGTVDGWRNTFRQRTGNPQYDPAQARRVIDARMRVLGALAGADARILMGTDAPQQFSVPGFSLHREIVRMREAGMTPYQVLRSGTAAVGEYFANEDTFGHVAVGHRADLILVGADPLEDLRALEQIEGVMVAGRWHAASEIEDRLDAIAEYHGN